MAGRNEKSGSRIERRPLKPPKNLIDLIKMLTEAILMLGYTETRHISNLPKAILHAVSDEGKKTVERECGERSDCVELKAPEMIKELYELKKCLTRTMLFSTRKRFLAFLLAAGFEKDDILLRKRTGRILRPAFTIIGDKETKCLFVFIRGTHSLKDMLTDAFCAPVSFDHFICGNKMVSGHAHRGMLAAASWIQKHCTPKLKIALYQNPHFKIKIVGHSLGGGTAALLTYKLREIPEFSSTTCVTFGPAACMTLELAEFGKSFITSIVNGSDIVPTLSASSVHDFMSDEGTSKDKSILSTVGSHFPITKAIAKHAVTTCAEVVMKHKHGTRSLLPWHRHEKNIDTLSSTTKLDNIAGTYGLSANNLELIHEEHLIMESLTDDDEYSSSSEESDNDGNSDDEEDEL